MNEQIKGGLLRAAISPPLTLEVIRDFCSVFYL